LERDFFEKFSRPLKRHSCERAIFYWLKFYKTAFPRRLAGFLRVDEKAGAGVFSSHRLTQN